MDFNVMIEELSKMGYEVSKKDKVCKEQREKTLDDKINERLNKNIGTSKDRAISEFLLINKISPLDVMANLTSMNKNVLSVTDQDRFNNIEAICIKNNTTFFEVLNNNIKATLKFFGYEENDTIASNYIGCCMHSLTEFNLYSDDKVLKKAIDTLLENSCSDLDYDNIIKNSMINDILKDLRKSKISDDLLDKILKDISK